MWRYPADESVVLRIDRHSLGPRVYVLGTRVHEWHLGAALLLGLALAAALRDLDPNLATGAAIFIGVWLVAKDWHDLVPSRRDTAARRARPYLPPPPPPGVHPAARLP